MNRVQPEDYPWWVKLTMLGGASTRNRALIYFALTIGLALVALVFWLSNYRVHWLAIAILGVLAAVMYPLAIRWIDRNGTWQ